MKIDLKLECPHANFDTATDKIIKIANFWSRLNLSLPGRIAVAKTFLVSQINHIGCILMPTDKQLHNMQSVVDKFCLGKLRIAKDKLYLNAKCGSLALINLREFLISQHVVWFKRVYQSTRDN